MCDLALPTLCACPLADPPAYLVPAGPRFVLLSRQRARRSRSFAVQNPPLLVGSSRRCTRRGSGGIESEEYIAWCRRSCWGWRTAGGHSARKQDGLLLLLPLPLADPRALDWTFSTFPLLLLPTLEQLPSPTAHAQALLAPSLPADSSPSAPSPPPSLSRPYSRRTTPRTTRPRRLTATVSRSRV